MVCSVYVYVYCINVGRWGGGQGAGGRGQAPPIILGGGGGGATYPLAPNNPPTFSFNFYVKKDKITNVPS